MRRALAILLLLPALARAGDDSIERIAAIEAMLDQERFAEALADADRALAEIPDDAELREVRAQAVLGVARDLQRAKGYEAAIDYLEPRLDHALVAYGYGETCFWAGAEERGIRGLRAAPLPVAERIVPEFRLLWALRRYEEAERRAEEIGWTDAAVQARGEEAWQAEVAGRTRTALLVSVAAAAALVAGTALAVRLARPRTAPAA